MDHTKYIELMSAVLDGECTAEERRALDSHLAVCPECGALFEILSANAKAARELDCEMPADLKERILNHLPRQEQPKKQGKVIHWKRWIPVAAAACLVLVVSLVPFASRGGNAASEMANANPALSSSLFNHSKSGTADGSYGVKGFVTTALEAVDYTYFYTCGPEPMLKAVYRASKTSGQMSFEERMGCGFGACMGCSCKTLTGYKRICKEGPVMKKEEILW